MENNDRKNDDIIVDITDSSNIEVINSELVAESIIESYFQNGTYEKLPLDIMKKVYNSLIDVDYKKYITDNTFMNEREHKFHTAIEVSAAFTTSIFASISLILTGSVAVFVGTTAFFLVGFPNIKMIIHEIIDKKILNSLIDDVAKEYCLLPAKEFKRLEQLRNENVITKELIELERKESSLKEEYDKLELIKQEDNRSKLIETGINNASKQVNDNLTILNDLIDEKYQKIKKYVVPRDILFTEVDGIIRFSENIKENLRYIDLSFVDFKNVDVTGIDFSDCNPVLLDPQTVYNKDLSNTVFINDPKRVNNVFPFGATTNFNGVNLTNAEIVSDVSIFINFDGAIINEECNIENGNKFVKIKK